MKITYTYNPKSSSYRKMESNIANYTVPNPLQLNKGEIIRDKGAWFTKRRPEILEFYRENIYGRVPDSVQSKNLKFEIRDVDSNAIKGKATRKQIRIYLIPDSDKYKLDVLLFIPNEIKRPVPAFLGLNFFGNHTTYSDPKIFLPESWTKNSAEMRINNNTPTEKSRNRHGFRWETEYLINAGYATATAYYGDIVPDRDDGLELGITAHYRTQRNSIKNEVQPRTQNEWGAVSAWAWGLSRIMDYLEKDNDIDTKRIALHGHSRLGKTALWAGAQDERFAVVISNCSGCLGAALKKRKFGETYAMINRNFPHWFSLNCRNYNNKEELLPVDQHMLISLIAPRPVYVASASRDLGADPYGEYLSAKHASPVYQLFGKQGLDTTGIQQFPQIERPISSIIGHHIRKGKHNILKYDWTQYIRFCNKYLGTE